MSTGLHHLHCLPAAALLALVITVDAHACALKPKAYHIAVRAIDGESIALDNGEVIRLAGILAPRAPPGAGANAVWPAESAAREALGRLVLGRRLSLAFPGRKQDRYGRLVAHVFTGEGGKRIRVEETLVREGHARVLPTPASGTCTAELLAAESEARRERRGLWTEATYSIKPAEKPADLLASELRFEIVEGRVLRVSASKSSVHIEFGRRWREDFTAVIRGRDRQAFARAGIDLALLAGRRIRVRGFIERRNGPLMQLGSPDSIELLDAVKGLQAPPP